MLKCSITCFQFCSLLEFFKGSSPKHSVFCWAKCIFSITTQNSELFRIATPAYGVQRFVPVPQSPIQIFVYSSPVLGSCIATVYKKREVLCFIYFIAVTKRIDYWGKQFQLVDVTCSCAATLGGVCETLGYRIFHLIARNIQYSAEYLCTLFAIFVAVQHFCLLNIF